MARYVDAKRPQQWQKTLQGFRPYVKKHWLAFVLVAICAIFSATVNLTGTYMISPIINDYILPHHYDGLVKMILGVAGMYLCGVLSTAFYKQLMTRVAQSIVKELRHDLFAHMQTLPISYFDTHTHGEVMSHFTNDMDTLQDALNNCVDNLIQSFTMIVGTVIAIFLLNWALSLIVTAFMLFMAALIQYFGRRSKYYFSRQQVAMAAMNGFIEEMVEGSKVVKVFRHEQANQKEFQRRNEALRDSAAAALTYAGRTIPTVVSLSYVNYAIVSCIGGFFAIAGMLSLGELSSYLIYVRQTAMPINQFTQQLNFILAAMAGAERIFNLLEVESECDDGRVSLSSVTIDDKGRIQESDEPTGKWAWRHPRAQGVTYVPLEGDVRFHDVVFGYRSDTPILKGISLYAKPGQKIAFVGSTGAGKTTIINLINRFYDISRGSITYDGIDVKLIRKDDLRHAVAVVLQDTHLFSGTVAENIRFGNPRATMDQVIAAAKLANAHHFISHLPKGYDTAVHSDGANLSQGQRQLLAIARAAIADPPVLILDEATSSIDTRSEKLIEKGMDRLMEGRTVFVIAHRLSTVRNADAIMVLDHGEIIERGSHDELLAQKGRYYQLYTGQSELD